MTSSVTRPQSAGRGERLEFAGGQGHRLAARLDLPEGDPVGHAVFVHCFTCTKDSPAAARISRGLTRHGIGVLRLDLTGLGESDGDFADTTFSSGVDDVVAAAEHLLGLGRVPRLLVGHSLGGAAVIAAAGVLPGVRAVVTIAAPFRPAHLTEHLGGAVRRIERDGEAEVLLAGRPFTVRRDFLEDIAQQPQARRLHELGRPLLVLHSPDDEVVPVEQAQQIFRAARHPRSFVALDGVDHLVTRRADADFVAGIVAAWAGRYVADDGDDGSGRA